MILKLPVCSTLPLRLCNTESPLGCGSFALKVGDSTIFISSKTSSSIRLFAFHLCSLWRHGCTLLFNRFAVPINLHKEHVERF